MRSILVAIMTAGLVIAPISATAAARTTAPVDESEHLKGSPILVIVLIALILGALVVALSDSTDPVSP